MNEATVRHRLAQVEDDIDRLYWAFTRTKRGKPPACVRPELYREREELRAMLRILEAGRGA